MRLPMGFHYATPVGQIMTRFTTDVAAVEGGMLDVLYTTLYVLVNVSYKIILLSIFFPLSIFAALVNGTY